MIPCYFTIEELEALKSYTKFFQDKRQWGDKDESPYDMAALLEEALDVKIQLHK
jgi:hypothetical protein